MQGIVLGDESDDDGDDGDDENDQNKENIIQQKQVNFGQVIQSHSFFWQKNFGLVQTCPVAKYQQVLIRQFLCWILFCNLCITSPSPPDNVKIRIKML